MTAEELLQDYEPTGMTPDDKVKEWLKADEEDRLVSYTNCNFDGPILSSDPLVERVYREIELQQFLKILYDNGFKELAEIFRRAL